MKAMLVGLASVVFTDEQTREVVEGVRLHIERKDPYVTGLCVDPIFMRDRELKNIGHVFRENDFDNYVGRPIDLEFNRRGKIVALEFADDTDTGKKAAAASK